MDQSVEIREDLCNFHTNIDDQTDRVNLPEIDLVEWHLSNQSMTKENYQKSHLPPWLSTIDLHGNKTINH